MPCPILALCNKLGQVTSGLWGVSNVGLLRCKPPLASSIGACGQDASQYCLKAAGPKAWLLPCRREDVVRRHTRFTCKAPQEMPLARFAEVALHLRGSSRITGSRWALLLLDS